MNRAVIFGGTLLLALSAQTASAADMLSRVAKAPPMVAAPAFSWTGCYAGVHAGGGWGDKDWYDIGQKFAEHNVRGWLAGGQLGCDVQAGSFVFGIEGQGSWAEIKGGADNIFTDAFASHSRIERMLTATGRVGYAWDRALLYIRGGGAWAHEEHWQTSDALNGGVLTRGDSNRRGWLLGAGLEWVFAPNWSVKLEYNYVDFGSDLAQLRGLDSLDTDIDQDLHTVIVGLNYRFATGGKAPVVTKY
jgi:outer membrane immunogenic protein